MKEQETKKTGMITRTSILILCAALLGAAAFGLGPADMRVYLLLAGVAGMIAFFGLDYVYRKAGTPGAAAPNAAPNAGNDAISQRMQQHASRTAPRKEDKAKSSV